MIPHKWKCGTRQWRCLYFPSFITLQCLVHGLRVPSTLCTTCHTSFLSDAETQAVRVHLPVLYALHRREGLIVEAEVEAEGASVPGVHPERPSDLLLRPQRPAGVPRAAPHASPQGDARLLQPLRCS